MKKTICVLALILCLGVLWGCSASRQEDVTDMTQERMDSGPATVSVDPTGASASEPLTEPATQPATEPVTQPATELITEPATVPVTEPPTLPPTEPTPLPTERATQPPTEPVTVPVTKPEGPAALQYGNMKAIWLSQYDLTPIYLDGSTQRGEDDFTARMARVLDNVKSMGFNTVMLQVRPNADSMYPSAYYPVSAYVAGQIGRDLRYDPVAIIVRLAHERALSIHAWINPMRGMTEAELQQIGQEYAMRRWYDDPQLRGRYIVSVNGRWYLNPAYEAVRELICSGAEEVLRLYPFDGLHMDDYFYPTTDSTFDAEAYAAYGGNQDLADFRRGALNKLVSALYEVTQQAGAGRIFGISPAGNVNTVYNNQFADVYRWCKAPGYIDYICPQVYFGLEHGSFDFVKVCKTYQDMIRTDSVDLIVGMTFGKALTREDQWASSGRDEWENNRDVLARCLQTTTALEDCRGVAVFCYQYLFDPLSGQEVAETAEERSHFVPLLQQIAWK